MGVLWLPFNWSIYVVNAPLSSKGPTALDIKSATLHTIRVVLHSADSAALLEALDQRMHEAGAFFQHEPVVIDSNAVHEPINWPVFVQALKAHQLYPIGISGSAEHQQAAAKMGLAPVELSTTKASLELPEPEPATPTPIAVAPLVLRQTLRSGQRAVAPEGDLIIIGSVGQGAEIFAYGNIYVYGPLRGKAIAGAQGNTQAFIAATEFDPELIAIAGVYSVIEDPEANPHHKQSAMVRLNGESLDFEPLS